jgi:DNA invertase Pin-like site-specific DNA recombinase
MGRLVLNILLSFAQFEREIIAERTRDKIAATRRKGKWCGGMPLLGYDVDLRTTQLMVNEEEAERVRAAVLIGAVQRHEPRGDQPPRRGDVRIGAGAGNPAEAGD